MRPIRLSLQAFGPFSGKEIIDFESVLDIGLFGIYGPTGAGKTSIFDGICFALFGQSSGAQRDGRDFRSDHASREILTEVEFIFDLGTKRYVIHRIPAQERASKRGDKTTAQAHNAWLFDATGLDACDIQNGNRGQAIAEKKISLTDKAIQELLGYTSDQFRQITLLPQGQFRKVLDANTNERSTILKQLFDVSLYEHLQEQLKEKSRMLEQKVKEARIRRDDRISQAGHESFEELEVGITEAEKLAKAANEQLKLTKTDHSKAIKSLEEAKAANAQFIELEKAAADLAHLNSKQNQIEEKQGQLALAKNAQSLLGTESALSLSKDDQKTAQTRFDQSVEHVSNAEKAHKDAERQLSDMQKQASKLDELSKIQIQLDTYLDIHTQAAKFSKELLATEENRKASHALVNALKQDIDRTKSGIKNLNEQTSQAAQRSNDILKIEQSVKDLQEKSEQLQKKKQLETEIAQLLSDVKTSDTKHKEALQKLQTAQLDFENADAALSSVQAVHLASKLHTGDNCPVCGSTDHPKPAHGDASSKGLDAAFRSAKDKLQQSQKEEREVNNELINQTAKYETSKQRLKDAQAPDLSLDEINTALTLQLKELKTLSALPTLPQLEAQTTKLLAKEKAETDKFDEALKTHQANQSKHDTAKARHDDALEKLPKAYLDSRHLQQEQKRLSAQIDTLTKDLKTATQAERDAQTALENCKTSQKELQETVNRTQKRFETSKIAFDTALKTSKLDLGSYTDAKLLIPQIDKLEADISTHSNAIIAAKARQEMAKKSTKDKEPPDLAALQAALNTLEEKLNEKNENANAASHRLKDLKTVRSSVADANTELTKLDAEYAPLGTLADLTNGSNPYKIKLTDFAIAAMYDDVLEAANQRLGPMTDGRFELRREAGATGGHAFRGLDTLIFDTHTESLRATSTLSGGEGFLASLSLALGLSDIVQQQSGGVRLDAIFIDEGFGSLDPESLDLALETLQNLANNNRLVGIISHVDEVKRTIPNGFSVETSPSGSHIKPRHLSF